MIIKLHDNNETVINIDPKDILTIHKDINSIQIKLIRKSIKCYYGRDEEYQEMKDQDYYKIIRKAELHE